jgi:hypothetical protein
MKKIFVIVFCMSSLAIFGEEVKKVSKKHKENIESESDMDSDIETKHVVKKSKKHNFERNYGMAGCGLGSIVAGKKGGQVSAATTNGTSFNQMIGISMGTLNCIDPQSAEVANRMDQFIIVNKDQLQNDIARGNGESISVISSFLGCTGAETEIGAYLKSNYSKIFNKAQSANEVTDGIINVILENSELLNKCSKVVV